MAIERLEDFTKDTLREHAKRLRGLPYWERPFKNVDTQRIQDLLGFMSKTGTNLKNLLALPHMRLKYPTEMEMAILSTISHSEVPLSIEEIQISCYLNPFKSWSLRPHDIPHTIGKFKNILPIKRYAKGIKKLGKDNLNNPVAYSLDLEVFNQFLQ